MDLKQFRSVLGWSVVINFALLIIVSILFFGASEWIYDIWALFIVVPFDAIDILMFAFIAIWKLFVIVFFLVPYWAIGRVLKDS